MKNDIVEMSRKLAGERARFDLRILGELWSTLRKRTGQACLTFATGKRSAGCGNS